MKIIYKKLESFASFIIAKIVKPDMEFDKVTDINQHIINDFKSNYGIEGIILDLDETLRNKTNTIPDCNKKWIELVRKNFKVIVVSNGKCQKAKKYFQSIGIDYIFFACKPARAGFKKACESLRLRPDKIMVIGNSLFNDIYGAQRSNMKGALIKGVEEDER